VLKFDGTGKLLMTFGRKGTGIGEFDQPHALAMDSRGRLFVGDRSNDRIQIFDQNGRHLETWTQFSRASGIFIDANDVIYVADSESGSIAPGRPEWKRGIRIGNALTGEVTAFIPDPVAQTRNTSAAEGVAVDRNGVIYGAEVGPRALKRYVRSPEMATVTRTLVLAALAVSVLAGPMGAQARPTPRRRGAAPSAVGSSELRDGRDVRHRPRRVDAPLVGGPLAGAQRALRTFYEDWRARCGGSISRP
jgi:hypothetical protein